MIRTASRIRWLLVGLAGSVLCASPCRAKDNETKLHAAFAKGEELRQVSKYKEAAAAYETALALAPETVGKDRENTAGILNLLGITYEAMDQHAKAESLYQRSLKIYEDKLGKDHPTVATVLNNLGNLYRTTGQYAKAKPLYLRSLKIREEKLGKDHLDVAASLNNLGDLHQSMGQYAKVEPLCLRALKIREDKLGKDHPDVAVSLDILALAYHGMAQYAKAEPLFERSLKIREDKLGKDDPRVAVSLGHLATLYDYMGQYDKAEPLHLRSLKIQEDKFGKDHLNVAASLFDLAFMYEHMNQYAKAEPLYLRGLKIQEDKLGKNHPRLAVSLNDLGVMYTHMGQYAKAEPLLQRSLKICEEKLGKDHPYLYKDLNNLAVLYNDMGQYAKAEPLYLRSLQLRVDKFGKDHPDVARGFSNLSTFYAEQARWKEAVDAADQERRIVRRHVARVLPILSEKEQIDFLTQTDAKDFRVSESLALVRRNDAGLAALSAGWVLNGKAVAQEALAQRALLALGDRDHATGSTKAGGPSSRVDPWVELAEVRKALAADAVLIEISRFRVFNFQGKDKKWQGSRYAAWVIPAEGDVHMVDLGPAGAVENAVEAVRQALRGAQGTPKDPSTITQDGEPDAEKAMLKPLQELSRLVLKPLSEHIDGKKRWYVSPDASLWLIPWAALPLKDGRYAVEAHSISYLVSGRDLAAAPSNVQVSRSRIMADPDYDLRMAEARAAVRKLGGRPSDAALTSRSFASELSLGKAARLPGTAMEARAIKPALEKYTGEQVWLYQRGLALEGLFKSFRSPRVLVLSTHGFFLEDQEVAPSDKFDMEEKHQALNKEGKPLENPLLRCGLLLAGCNHRDQAQEGDEDGVLTGLEVASTDLRGTELVVLSACETGLGEVHNSEGVAGLRQAFQLAGARAVAATLWQIPDRESAKLMGDFFANLGNGKDKADALREAQLTMIRTRREKNAAAHPFFWAAYTLTGR